MLTRIGHRSSSLKTDLYGLNIIPSPAYSCGPPIENAEHYFFQNVPYTLTKETIFFINLHRLQIYDIDVAVLTAGSNEENINRSIIQFAIKLIKDSQRFE